MFLLQFIFAFASTIGFSIIFNIPRRHILPASLCGACGWLAFQYLLSIGEAMVFACFMGACIVSILSEIFCRFFKEASTVFIIPGILPLVPGAGMYHTMLSLLNKDFSATAEIGTQTLLMAGSIAIAILIISSFIRTISLITNSFRG